MKKQSLLQAVGNNDLNLVKRLIDDGIDINTQDHSFGVTTLMYAAYKGYFDIVQHLIEQGADIDVKNNNNDTALVITARAHHLKIVKYLIEVQGHSTEIYLSHSDKYVRDVVKKMIA